jgi:hypothetical protein
MRNQGLGLATFLVTAGAILAWAVTLDVEGIDIQQVGVIMFVVGVIVGVATLIMAASGKRTTLTRQNESVVNGVPAVTEVETEVVTQRNDAI